MEEQAEYQREVPTNNVSRLIEKCGMVTLIIENDTDQIQPVILFDFAAIIAGIDRSQGTRITMRQGHYNQFINKLLENKLKIDGLKINTLDEAFLKNPIIQRYTTFKGEKVYEIYDPYKCIEESKAKNNGEDFRSIKWQSDDYKYSFCTGEDSSMTVILSPKEKRTMNFFISMEDSSKLNLSDSFIELVKSKL